MSPFGIGPEHSSDSVALARLPPPELESHQARIWSGTFHICEDILAARFSGDIAACDQLNGGTAHSSETQYSQILPLHIKDPTHWLLLRQYHTRGSTVAPKKKKKVFDPISRFQTKGLICNTFGSSVFWMGFYGKVEQMVEKYFYYHPLAFKSEG